MGVGSISRKGDWEKDPFLYVEVRDEITSEIRVMAFLELHSLGILEPLKYRPTYEPPCLTQVLATPLYKSIYRFIGIFEVQFFLSHFKAINERET